MNEFLERMAECLELPSVTAEHRFRETPGWSSLMGFAMLVTMENDYGRLLTPEEFARAQTLADLAREMGV